MVTLFQEHHEELFKVVWAGTERDAKDDFADGLSYYSLGS